MIHYSLHCADGHEFDGWFPGAAAFEQQAASGHISCPTCGSTRITRALMAPALPRKANARAEAPAAPTTAPADTPPAPAPAASPPASPPANQMAMLPDALRVALQKLRAEVEKRADYVGNGFADEARRIHNGEVTARPIYGEATESQAEALAEDGIEVARIPWVPRADS